MKTHFKPVRYAVTTVLALAALSLLAPLCLADSPDHPSEEHTLTHAYRLLSVAKHDYDGHRLNAMHAVERAGKELNADIHGEDHNKPDQRESDELMHEAERELHAVRDVAADRHQDRVITHVDEAIHEIHVALGIR